MPAARASARWTDARTLWLDHTTLRDADAAWLEPVTSLTLWAVPTPPGLLASLPHLRHLDVRGGSGTDLAVLEGCTQLRGLQVNQVRGLADLGVVPTLTDLRVLSLYGLPKVAAVPSLAALRELERVELGSLKGLTGLTGVHDAPALRELLLLRALGLAAIDAERLAAHPTLSAFDWVAEDVPARMWEPFVAAVGKPRTRPVHADAWLRERGHLD